MQDLHLHRKMLWAAFAVYLALLPSARLAFGHLPELFGHEYVRVQALSSNTITPVHLPTALEETGHTGTQQDAEAFEEQVKNSERAHGPYATGLTDPLISLGIHYYSLGKHEQALEAYRRALHVARVNDGLTSDRQIPILRGLIRLYRESGDFESLDGAFRYYARVQAIGAVPPTRQELDDGLEYFEWQREAYTSRRDGKQAVHLLQAYLGNEQMLKALSASEDADPEWFRQLVMSQMRNLYLLLSSEPVTLHDHGFIPGQLVPDEATLRRIQYIQKSGISRGQELLKEAIVRGQAFEATDRAALHLELGDWYQYHSKFSKAGREYAQVVKILSEAGQDDLLSQWLEQPMELPDERELWQLPPEQDQHGGLVVVAQYKVSARGEARSLKVSVPGADSSGQARRIKAMLRETHFRPRFVRGVAESSEPVTRTYRLLD